MKYLKQFAQAMQTRVREENGEFITVNRVMLSELAEGCLELLNKAQPVNCNKVSSDA